MGTPPFLSGDPVVNRQWVEPRLSWILSFIFPRGKTLTDRQPDKPHHSPAGETEAKSRRVVPKVAGCLSERPWYPEKLLASHRVTEHARWLGKWLLARSRGSPDLTCILSVSRNKEGKTPNPLSTHKQHPETPALTAQFTCWPLGFSSQDTYKGSVMLKTRLMETFKDWAE